MIGIQNVIDFYKSKDIGESIGNFLDENPLLRFDIKYAKIMWIYNSIRPCSTVLDLGCGAGLFNVLKRKNVMLVGLDGSLPALKRARTDDYYLVTAAEGNLLPFPNHCFDYVISNDVFVQIDFTEKNQILSEMKRVLKPDGMVMHSMEVGHINYNNLTADEKKYLIAAGHVGMETEEQIRERFQKFFSHVDTRTHFKVIRPYHEIRKEVEVFGFKSPYDKHFINKLKTFTQAEIDAFDLAMGHAFHMFLKRDIKMSEKEGFALLKAGDQPLGPWAGDYPYTQNPQGMVSLESKDLGPGWYGTEIWPPLVRWTSEHAEFKIDTSPKSNAILIKACCHHPDVDKNPVALHVIIERFNVQEYKIDKAGWQVYTCPIPESSKGSPLTVELRLDRAFIPAEVFEVKDHRRLGIAVERIWLDTF